MTVSDVVIYEAVRCYGVLRDPIADMEAVDDNFNN